MRTVLAAFFLVGTLLAVHPAGAQAPSLLVLEDAGGDVRIDAGGSQAAPDGADLYASADLRSLAIEETRTEILFVLAVDDLKPAQEQTAPDGFVANIYFSHEGREFQLRTGHGFAVVGNTFWAYLYQRDAPTADWSMAWSTFEEVRADFAAETLTVPILRDLLADSDGAAPYPGRSLDGILVRAGSQFRDSPFISGGGVPTVESPVVVADDMPNDASAAATYAIQLGVAQTGHAHLSSDMPFRASNGEATTYILTASAENLGDKPDTFTFGIVGASSQLTVVVPVQVLALEAGAKHDVPVLATVPFGHRHGDVESFVLEMTSETDPGSVGRIEMGIRFLAVPQPAGHHDTLYLHATAPQYGIGPVLQYQEGFMSTLEDDPAAEPRPYFSSSSGGFVGAWTHYFYYRLQPNLQIGLDFDIGRGGRLALPVGATEPMLGTTVAGDLYVWSADSQDRTTIALLGQTEPVDIDPNGQHLFELEFEADDVADRIPVEKGMELFLNVRVTSLAAVPTFGAADTGVYVAPGGSLKLPLNEWHDDVDDVLAALSGPGLSPLGEQERFVNPGKAAIFHVSIANPTDETARVLLEVSGPNAGWATLPATSVDVAAHDTARASVIVRAPSGTVSGERADLVLQAYAKDDPAARGLLRLVTIVDTQADHPDDTAAADELAKKESPGPATATWMSAMALAALALARRRR